MKMIYNNTPVKSMRVHNFDVNSNDATMIASDLQSGVVGYARGKKVVGTGKCFSFASYGKMNTNTPVFSPVIINVIEIASIDCPIKSAIALHDMTALDFSTAQIIGYAIVDGIEYPITVQVSNSILTLTCDKKIALEVFYGKDNYVL